MLSSLRRHFFCSFVEKYRRILPSKNDVEKSCRILLSKNDVYCRRLPSKQGFRCRKMLAKNVVGFLCRKMMSIAVEYKKMMSKFVDCRRKMLAKFTVELQCRIIVSNPCVEKCRQKMMSKNTVELFCRKILQNYVFFIFKYFLLIKRNIFKSIEQYIV